MRPAGIGRNGTAGSHAGVPALDAVRQAQQAWADAPLRQRLRVLQRFRRLLAAAAPALAACVELARGSPVAETLSAEILPLAEACAFLEREADPILRPRRLGRGGRPAWLLGVQAEVRREPFGVVLVVGPSNYPLFLSGVQVLQALAAGNAVLLKPAEGVGKVAGHFTELLQAAGLPHGLLTVLPESPAAVLEVVAAGVDKVVMTGSARTGAALLSELAPHLTPAVVELSGCDALFVRSDADLELVTQALAFGFRLRNGETCIAPRRVFVAAERADELEQRLRKLVAREFTRPVRSRYTAAAVALVHEALARGARVVAGRVLPDAAAMTPLVLADVTPDMPLLREDVFAPVVTLLRVGSDGEALELAGRCPYALGASVFGSEAGARELAGRVRAGVVTVNDVIVPTADPRLPFGGRGRSGFGLTRGAEGLLEMTAVKVVSVRRGSFRPHLAPAHPEDGRLLLSYLQARHGGTVRARIAGWCGLLRALARRWRQPVTAEEGER